MGISTLISIVPNLRAISAQKTSFLRVVSLQRKWYARTYTLVYTFKRIVPHSMFSDNFYINKRGVYDYTHIMYLYEYKPAADSLCTSKSSVYVLSVQTYNIHSPLTFPSHHNRNYWLFIVPAGFTYIYIYV